jgi:hypothetical protein
MSSSDVDTICEKLRLALLVDSDDMSYHWKFEELKKGEVGDYVDDGGGLLDREKFIKWWFMDTDELFHKNDQPPEEPPAEEAK